jgi:hypothetical protein
MTKDNDGKATDHPHRWRGSRRHSTQGVERPATGYCWDEVGRATMERLARSEGKIATIYRGVIIMSGPVRIIFAAILTLSVPALAAEPSRISDLDKFCEETVQTISSKARREAADSITNSMGKPEASGTLANALQIFEGKNFDFTKKVVDKNYNGVLRQIVYYSYVEKLGFAYFRFNFKMTSGGWILANFAFKDETNELFPKDFIER